MDSLKARYIEEAAKDVLSKDETLDYLNTKETIKTVASASISSIRTHMNHLDQEVIDMVIQDVSDGNSISSIKAKILKKELSQHKETAALNFAETYIASTDYWQENGANYVDYIDTNVIIVGKPGQSHWYDNIRWGDVALCDAYYAWYGTVTSGGNFYVGGGAAIVGSAFAVLNSCR